MENKKQSLNLGGQKVSNPKEKQKDKRNRKSQDSEDSEDTSHKIKTNEKLTCHKDRRIILHTNFQCSYNEGQGAL